MPATSKAQFRFMEAVQHGDIKKKGLSPSKASEFTSGVGYKGLPTRKEEDNKKMQAIREAAKKLK